jgi:hypothetical protein
MTENLKYIFLLFPIIGIGLFIGGLAYRRRLKAKVANFDRTIGTVIDNVHMGVVGFDTTPHYRPVVEYFVGGIRFTVTGDTGYGQRMDLGTGLTVMFSPKNPSVAFVVKDYYFVANILSAIGGTFVLLGSLIAYGLLV